MPMMSRRPSPCDVIESSHARAADVMQLLARPPSGSEDDGDGAVGGDSEGNA
jgi:hypothetical protein